MLTNNKLSNAVKQRHQVAKFQQQLYVNKFGEHSLKANGLRYSDFLKNKTPLENQIVVYDVSFQISYSGNSESLISNMATFKVIGFRGNETQIKSNTMEMVLDSKGKVTRENFQPNTLNAVENSTQIDIKARGLEESTANLSNIELRNLIEHGNIVKELDETLKFKNKKGREGTMNMDIRHFIH